MKGNLRVLVTGGRFPGATGLVRALHAAGATVDAADAYKLAPALHSEAVEQRHVVAATASDPLQFARDVAAVVRDRRIDLVVPSFEEGFYLANYAALVPAPIFAPDFATIERLHNKAKFHEVCGELDVPTPKTIVAVDREELRKAVAVFDTYLARPAFSRGGTNLLTNFGARAGEHSPDDFTPTATNPWIVQEFVEGTDACSLSIARNGRIVVHCTYEPAIAAAGGWSVKLSSIDDFGGLALAEKVCAALGFHGFIGFDFRRTPDERFVMIECNPRTSAGIFLMPPEWVGEAVIEKPDTPRTVAAGRRVQYDFDLINRNIIRLPARELVRTLLTTPDAFLKPRDVMPALCFFISNYHWAQVAKREHIDADHAFIGDISWDGTPMPKVEEAQRPAS